MEFADEAGQDIEGQGKDLQAPEDDDEIGPAPWARYRLLPLKPKGAFSADLSKCRQAALALFEKMAQDQRFKMIFPPELDILVWAPNGKKSSEISRLSDDFFQAAARENLHLAKFKYPSARLRKVWPEVDFDQPIVTCLRSCLMKPEYYDWIDRLWEIMKRTAGNLKNAT